MQIAGSCRDDCAPVVDVVADGPGGKSRRRTTRGPVRQLRIGQRKSWMRERGWLAYYCTSDKPRLEIRPSCFHWFRVSVQSHWLHVTPSHPQSTVTSSSRHS